MTFSIDDRLGLFPPLSWLVSDSPLISAILLFLVTPGGLWIVRLIGGRILLPSEELKATRAHIYFPVLLACNVALVNSATGSSLIPGYLSGAIQGLSSGGVLVFMLFYYLQHPEMKGRRSSLTLLYHLAASAVVAPALILTTVVGFIHGEWSFAYVVVRLVVVGCVLKFAWGFIDDLTTDDAQTVDGFPLLHMAHVDHSYPWQWMHKNGHWTWWWTRFRAGIGSDLRAIYTRR